VTAGESPRGGLVKHGEGAAKADGGVAEPQGLAIGLHRAITLELSGLSGGVGAARSGVRAATGDGDACIDNLLGPSLDSALLAGGGPKADFAFAVGNAATAALGTLVPDSAEELA
jgi:hypothetical protein